MKYGEILRKRRESLGYTQAQLSELSGIDQTIISRIETGRRAIITVQAEQLLNTLMLKLEFVEKVAKTKKRK